MLAFLIVTTTISGRLTNGINTSLKALIQPHFAELDGRS